MESGQSVREYFNELDKARLRARIAEERARAFQADSQLAAIELNQALRRCVEMQLEIERLKGIIVRNSMGRKSRQSTLN